MISSPIGRRRSRDDGVERAPVPFIVGVGRSGTTLLRMMLDAHPELAIPPETHFVPRVIARCERTFASRGSVAEAAIEHEKGGFMDSGVDPELYRARIAEMERLRTAPAVRAFFELYAAKHGKPRWGDKTPGYVQKIGRIGRVLPEARFIHLIRDGRDVALSLDRRLTELDHRERGVNIERAAHKWRERILKARQVAAGFPERYLELRYEDLVRDTEPTLRRACELIELEWDPEMLRYHERAEERLKEIEKDQDQRGAWVRSAESRVKAHEMTKKPPSPDRLDVWRREMGAEQVAIYEAAAGDLLAELGYDLSGEGSATQTQGQEVRT